MNLFTSITVCKIIAPAALSASVEFYLFVFITLKHISIIFILIIINFLIF